MSANILSNDLIVYKEFIESMALNHENKMKRAALTKFKRITTISDDIAIGLNNESAQILLRSIVEDAADISNYSNHGWDYFIEFYLVN